MDDNTSPTNELDSTIDDLRNLVTKNNTARDKLINKLIETIERIDLSEINSIRASDRESLMGVFTTADSIMKSQEAGLATATKAVQNKKSIENENNYGDLVMEMLKQLNPGHRIPVANSSTESVNDVDNKLLASFSQSDQSEITEGELETNTFDIAE